MLTVSTPSAFAAEMLERRLSSTICRVLERVAGDGIAVRFVVTGSGDQVPVAVPAGGAVSDTELDGASSTAAEMDDHRSLYALNKGMRFESFVTGPSNKLAHAAAARVAESPGQVYNPLYIYSPVGLGKTHLLHAIGHSLTSRGLKVIYVSAEKFTNEYIRAIRDGRADAFRERYRGADALLIDDIQFIASKEQTQEGFFHTFNELHMAGKQIVVSADQPASKTMLESRIQSRFAGGLVVDIDAPEYETRYAILEHKAQARGAKFPTNVLNMIAERCSPNVRELEGCLNRVIAYSQLVDEPVSMELAARAMVSLLARPLPANAGAEDVLAAVARVTGVQVDALKGRQRDRRTAHARRLAMYLLREEAGLPSTKVGEALGGKDHSTVLYAQKRLEESIDSDPSLRQELAAIRKIASELKSALN